MDQQSNSLVFMQKKQLTWLLAMVFVVVVAAITFSAFLINTLIKGQVANAVGQIRPATVQVVPAATSSDESGCVAPAGGQGGEDGGVVAGAFTSSTGAFVGGGGGLPAGGQGAGGAGGSVSNSTVTNNTTKSVTRNINSGNTIGSNNGSNNTTNQSNTNNVTVTDSFNQAEEEANYPEPWSLNGGGGGGSGGLSINNLNVSENNPYTKFKVEDSFDDSGNETSTVNNTRIDHNDVNLGLPVYTAVE